VRFKKLEKHMVISTYYYEIPDSEIASRFGSAERFTEILSHLGEDGLNLGGGSHTQLLVFIVVNYTTAGPLAHRFRKLITKVVAHLISVGVTRVRVYRGSKLFGDPIAVFTGLRT